MARSFKELLVWQRAVELALAVYRMAGQFPDFERYGLASQMRRASISISSNIAEGAGRASTGEFLQFLGNARGSRFELESQFVIVRGLGLGSAERALEAEALCQETGKLLSLLIQSVRAKSLAPRTTLAAAQPQSRSQT